MILLSSMSFAWNVTCKQQQPIPKPIASMCIAGLILCRIVGSVDSDDSTDSMEFLRSLRSRASIPESLEELGEGLRVGLGKPFLSIPSFVVGVFELLLSFSR